MADVVFNINQVVRILERWGKNARNTRPFMDVVAATLQAEIEDEFASQGRGRWEALSLATIARSPRRAGGMILQDTGLTANIQAQVSATVAEVFSPTTYAKHHVKGTKNMPKRDLLDIDLDKMMGQLAEVWTDEVIN